jgi:hypothetical protein
MAMNQVEQTLAPNHVREIYLKSSAITSEPIVFQVGFESPKGFYPVYTFKQ